MTFEVHPYWTLELSVSIEGAFKNEKILGVDRSRFLFCDMVIGRKIFTNDHDMVVWI